MADRVSRVYIDSTYKTVASASNGDFRIDLAVLVFAEAGSHIRVEGLLLSHVWPVIDGRNSHVFVREVVAGTSYHRVVTLNYGNYNLSTLAVQLASQLNTDSHISDGVWAVSNDGMGGLTISQSSTTFESARIFSEADVRGKRSIPIFIFPNVPAMSTSWPQAWAAADVKDTLVAGDACAIIGLPYNRLDFTPSSNTKRTSHVDLARHRALHLCSRELPQTSLTHHGRTDVVASIICAGSSPGSIIHNAFPSPSHIYCADILELRHLSFQVRDQADEIVDLSGHAVSFELVITRPYE